MNVTENASKTSPETSGEHATHDHDEHDHEGHDHGHGGGGHSHTVSATLEDAGPCKKKMVVSVPKDEVAREIDQRIDEVRRTVHVKGFRKGKVPRKFVEKNYKGAIEDEVRKHLLEHSYFLALKDKGVDPNTLLGEGKIDNLKFSAEEGLTYDVILHTRPKFELPDYKALKVEAAKVRVGDEEVDKQLEDFRKAKGEMRPVEDAAAVIEPTDILGADVEVWLADEYESFMEEKGEKKDAAKKDADADDLDSASGPLKPLKTYSDIEIKLPEDTIAGIEIEDLADALVGLKLGEWGEAETQLPVDYEVAEGRNEAAVVRVKVGSLKRLFLPALTDDWAKTAGFDSVEQLKRETRENLFRSKELRRTDEVEHKLLDQILRGIQGFDLPLELLEGEIADAAKRREIELRLHENKPEDEAKRMVEAEAAERRTDVERSLRLFFIVDEIARREKIQVSESDVDARIARIAASAGKYPSEVKKYLEERQVIPQLRHEILNEKTRAFLRERAQVTEVEE